MKVIASHNIPEGAIIIRIKNVPAFLELDGVTREDASLRHLVIEVSDTVTFSKSSSKYWGEDAVLDVYLGRSNDSPEKLREASFFVRVPKGLKVAVEIA